MGRHAMRPIYRRADQWMVVKPINLGHGKVLDVGTKIKSKDYRRFYIQTLWKRGRIGPVDHPWTKNQIAAWAAKLDAEATRVAEALATTENEVMESLESGDNDYEAIEHAEHLTGRLHALAAWFKKHARKLPKAQREPAAFAQPEPTPEPTPTEGEAAKE